MSDDGLRHRAPRDEAQSESGLELLERRTDSYLMATSGAVLGGDTHSVAAPTQPPPPASSGEGDEAGGSGDAPEEVGEAELEPNAEEELGPFRKRRDQQVNPLARMVFSWVSPVVKKGNKSVLQNEVRAEWRESGGGGGEWGEKERRKGHRVTAVTNLCVGWEERGHAGKGEAALAAPPLLQRRPASLRRPPPVGASPLSPL